MPTDHAEEPPWGSDPAAAPSWGTPESTAEVLAAQLEDTRFRTTGRFRTGYDQVEVDHFVYLVVRALRGGPDADALSWRDVAERVFFPTRWRPGYQPDDVDAALERVVRELRRRAAD